jgi:nucleoid-associated protein YejK
MLITPEYTKVLKDTHDAYKAKGKRWGVTAEKDHFFANTLNVINRWQSKAVLDYGSGSSGLRKRVSRYSSNRL